MKLNSLVTAAAVTTALTALAGCDREPDQPPMSGAPGYGQDRAAPATPPAGPLADRSTGASPEDSRSVGQALADAGITAKVKSALLARPDIDGSAINVDTERGRVTLRGQVPDEGQVDRAIQIARAVEGVKEVDSQLTARGAS